nr:hypothetical protein [Lachnospiraceae bacterium]
MKHIGKGILSMVLSVAMMLGVVPATAMTARADAPVVEVDTWSELYDALRVGGEIKLTGDVTYGEGGGDHASSNLVIPDSFSGTVTLDLNGHTIDR